MAMTREYFNQRAAIWDERIAEKDTTRLECLANRLNLEPGSTVLDVGSGTGVFLPFLLKALGGRGRIIALDFAERMLSQARAKGFGGNIDYLQADVAHIPIGDRTFDTVVCYSSFPHFRDKPGIFAEINRVTKPGGRLLICHTASRLSINRMHRQIPAVKDDFIPDEDEMKFMLSGAGFTEIRIDDESDSYLASARKPG